MLIKVVPVDIRLVGARTFEISGIFNANDREAVNETHIWSLLFYTLITGDLSYTLGQK